jgi:hypothetical protein
MCVGTFHTTYAVLKAEKLLLGIGVPVSMIPVPRRISSNCGIAIRFDCSLLETVRRAIEPVLEDLEGLYRPDGDEYRMY